MSDKLKVLVVDDNPTNRQVLLFLLKQYPCETTMAANGAEAIALAAKSAFDLIIMDCHMPVLDGLEASKVIRQHENESGHRSRIIALTAYGSPENREACMVAGMDDFFVKPVSRGMVQQWLDPKASEPVNPRPVPDQENTPHHPGDLKGIEHAIRQQLKILGLDFRTISIAATLLVEQLPDTCAQLHGAFAVQDRESVQKIAHKLKGTIGTFTAHQPFQACLALEMLSKRPETGWSELSVQLAEIERWRPGFITVLEKMLQEATGQSGIEGQ